MNNIVLLAALLLAVSWMWGTMGALQKNFALQQMVDRTEQEVEVMEIETQMLEFQKRYLESDEYLELAARERLNKASPGEKVLMLPPNTPIAEQPNEVSQLYESVPPPSNFSQWMTFFFGVKPE